MFLSKLRGMVGAHDFYQVARGEFDKELVVRARNKVTHILR
jgi:hypothetical protein